MKKCMLMCAACAALVSVSYAAESFAVACWGRVVPGDRISKLSASSPSGSQAVLKTLDVSRGEIVKKGGVVATLQGIDKARAALERAKAALSRAKSSGEIRLLQQKNLVADLQGNFDQNRRVLEEKDPPRREREQLEFEQEAVARRIAQSKAMLPLVEMDVANTVAEAQTAVVEAQKHLDEFTVRAPISGEIVDLSAERGEAVGIDGICEIANTDKMCVNAEVYVADVSKVKVGAFAQISSDALGSGKFGGVVEKISASVKSNKIFSSDPSDYSNTRVVIVKIAISDPAKFRNLIGSQVRVKIK